jgi:hypothetical protein
LLGDPPCPPLLHAPKIPGWPLMSRPYSILQQHPLYFPLPLTHQPDGLQAGLQSSWSHQLKVNKLRSVESRMVSYSKLGFLPKTDDWAESPRSSSCITSAAYWNPNPRGTHLALKVLSPKCIFIRSPKKLFWGYGS